MYPASTQKLLGHPAAMLGMLRRATLAAGDAIMEYYDPSGFHGDVVLKDDQSPVTPADLAADHIIREFLTEHFPGIPAVTEETAHIIDHARLAETDHYWLVDGLDGTRAFRRGDRDFTVNIALINHDAPVLGVVYAPAHGEGFMGAAGDTKIAQRWRNDTSQEDDIRVRMAPHHGITLLTSHTDKLSAFSQSMMDQVKVNKHNKRSSSIKYTEVAAGRADLAITTREIYYWDTAAGDAVIRGAGGYMVSLDGMPLRYDRHVPNLANRGLIACGDLDYLMPVIQDLAHLKP